jgi:hypothetical protein
MVTSTQDTSGRARVRRDPRDDSTEVAARARRELLGQRTGAGLNHVGRHSFDPSVRMNFTTGDAAGQNLTGKAALAACEWSQEHR